MAKISTENQERLGLMNGCEVQSLNYEGCVSIRNGQVWLDGEMVDELDSDDKINKLWEEYVSGELQDDDFYY